MKRERRDKGTGRDMDRDRGWGRTKGDRDKHHGTRTRAGTET